MEQLLKWLGEERGRKQRLANQLGVYASALSQWTQVPATRAAEVSTVTGIPLHELRPDVFPAPKEGVVA